MKHTKLILPFEDGLFKVDGFLDKCFDNNIVIENNLIMALTLGKIRTNHMFTIINLIKVESATNSHYILKLVYSNSPKINKGYASYQFKMNHKTYEIQKILIQLCMSLIREYIFYKNYKEWS